MIGYVPGWYIFDFDGLKLMHDMLANIHHDWDDDTWEVLIESLSPPNVPILDENENMVWLRRVN